MNLNALVDAHAVAELWEGLRPSTIRTWEARNRITRQGRDSAGRNLYRMADIQRLVTERDEWLARRRVNHNGVM